MVIARMNYGIVSAEKLGDFDGAINQYDETGDIILSFINNQ